MEKYTHNKTGRIYLKASTEFINTTNGENDGQIMVAYKHGDKMFVREKMEFHNKFSKTN